MSPAAIHRNKTKMASKGGATKSSKPMTYGNPHNSHVKPMGKPKKSMSTY